MRLDALLAEVLSAAPHADRSALIEEVRHVDPLISSRQLNEVVEQAWQRAHGLGPITALLADPEITEVMVNGPGPVWIDRHGRLEPTDIDLGAVDLDLLIERIVDPLGLRVDRVSPMVDGRLPDGSRVNIVVPPLAVDGPVITIRRFAARPLPLTAFGPPELVALLGQLMDERKSIVVSGGTGAGKTTLLNSLGGLLRRDERVIVIEDTAELRLPGDHVVRLEARTANAKTLVIFDEVHHAGDALSWGEAVDQAFALATRRLSLTGTPFRSDATPIPFVRYAEEPDGTRRSVPDYTYGYAEALRELFELDPQTVDAVAAGEITVPATEPDTSHLDGTE